jgi:mannose-6-phosphate isomerase-like protein (cupin superfamily)
MTRVKADLRKKLLGGSTSPMGLFYPGSYDGRLISERPPSLSLIRCFIKREQKDSGGVIELRSLADIVYYGGAPKGGLRRQMIIKKSESTKYPNSSKCTTYEYPHGDKDINISLAILDGRYPDEGRVMNTVCKEIVYIVGGKGKMEIDGRGFSVAPGDSIFIKPGQKYFYDGRLEMVATCHPSWFAKQHVKCD